MTGVSISEAARALGTSRESLRRWCREDGCPSIQIGRGRYRVDVAAVRAWRAAGAPDREALLREIAELVLDFWRRGAEPGAEGQRVLGISDATAAKFLCFLLNYLARRTIKPSGDNPVELRTPAIELLAAIALQGNVHGMNDSVQWPGQVK